MKGVASRLSSSYAAAQRPADVLPQQAQVGSGWGRSAPAACWAIRGLIRSPPRSAEKLENRLPGDHPALLAARTAPVESETDEERDAVEDALNSGQLVPGSIVTAEIARRARRSRG